MHAAIANAMAEVGAVAKGRRNPQQGYLYRGIADIYQACQLVMAKHGLHLAPVEVLDDQVVEREAKGGGGRQMYIRQRIKFHMYHVDGSYVTIVTTGEAMDSGDKATNKCMSAAVKYALIVAFCIPEDDPSADTESASPEIGVATGTKAPKDEEPDPLWDLRKLVSQNPPKGPGWGLVKSSEYFRKWFGAKDPTFLSPPQVHDATLLAKAATEDGDAAYGPRHNDVWGPKMTAQMEELVKAGRASWDVDSIPF